MVRPTTEAEKKVREYLAKIGRRGGLMSRRELTRRQAKQMVAIREAQRAARKEGKILSSRDRKRLMMRAGDAKPTPRRLPGIRKRSFPSYGPFYQLS